MVHCERADVRRVGEKGRGVRSDRVFSRDMRARTVGGLSGEDGG